MQLFYKIIFLLVILEVSVAKPLNDINSSNISTAAEPLISLYNTEYDLMVQDVCIKMKNITEEILKDEIVQNATGGLMLYFKKNITHCYPIYKFYKCNEAVLQLPDTIKKHFNYPQFKNDKDYLYINQLLRLLGYSDIRDKYNHEFKKFLNEKFLPKSEDFKTQISQQINKTESDLKVLEWIDFLKKCQEYECFLNDFNTYKRKTEPFLIRLLEDMSREISKALTIVTYEIFLFTKAVLEEPKLLQISTPTRQQLTKNLQDIIKIFDNANEAKQLYYFYAMSYLVLFRYDNYTDISLKDRQLITDIFNDHGYKEIHLLLHESKFVNLDYVTEYIEIENTAPAKELKERKQVLEAIAWITNSTTVQESDDAFNRTIQLISTFTS